jgi:spermidine/putrescine transport system ATP-binding protein
VEIYERPNCKFVADFIGDTNFLEGDVRETESGKITVFVPKLGSELVGMSQSVFNRGDKAVISIRPEKMRLSDQPGLHLNSYEVRVTNSAYIGSDTRLEVEVNGIKLKVWEQNHISTLDPRAYHQGEQRAWVSIMPENALVLPLE